MTQDSTAQPAPTTDQVRLEMAVRHAGVGLENVTRAWSDYHRVIAEKREAAKEQERIAGAQIQRTREALGLSRAQAAAAANDAVDGAQIRGTRVPTLDLTPSDVEAVETAREWRAGYPEWIVEGLKEALARRAAGLAPVVVPAAMAEPAERGA